MTRVYYNELASIITTSGAVPVLKDCNGWVAINKGTTLVKVNGVDLNPPPAPGLSGESLGVSGNLGEVYSRPDIKVSFPTAGPGNVLLIVQKLYGANTFDHV